MLLFCLITPELCNRTAIRSHRRDKFEKVGFCDHTFEKCDHKMAPMDGWRCFVSKPRWFPWALTGGFLSKDRITRRSDKAWNWTKVGRQTDFGRPFLRERAFVTAVVRQIRTLAE